MRYIVGLLVALTPALASAEHTFNDGKGETWDCAKDSRVTINNNNASFTFKGACINVTINGNHNTVTIESAATVTVNGNEITANVGSTERIQVNGNNNTVSYKGKPKVSNLGNNNKVSAGGGEPAKPADKDKDKDKPAPSSGATAVDCGKTAEYSITTGDGSYKFTGTCTKISVTGGENTLAIEAVKTLSVAGAENKIDVTAADTISAVGTENTIRWKKGISGAKPKISSVGANNKIEQVK